MASATVEDYLKTIFLLTQQAETASTSALAEKLGVAAGTVTGMLKRLAEQGLVDHVPYYGAQLTVRGRQQALALVRRHRLIELFLVRMLGYGWDRVHAEAERLEHAVTDELVDRMAGVLGGPVSDPHGAPIPEPGRPYVEPVLPSLCDVEVGRGVVVRRVLDQDPEALRYLERLGLVPGAEIRVLERAPFDGPLCIAVGDARHFIGTVLSRQLKVELVVGRRYGRRDGTGNIGGGRHEEGTGTAA